MNRPSLAEALAAYPDDAPELSAVVPVYNGAETVPILVEKLSALAKFVSIEIVLVNDGSRDDSAAVCRKLAETAAVPVTFVDLARNFGEHNAVMAGLGAARGRWIVTMDDDLQHSADDVLELYRCCREQDYDVVYAYWDRKKHNWFRNLGSKLTNRMASALFEKPEDLYFSTFRCMSGPLARMVASHEGPFPYVDGLIVQHTQRLGRFKVVHHERAGGTSGYNLRRLMRLWLTVMTSFSVAPLRLSAMIGFGLSAIGMLFAIRIIVLHYLREAPEGWASMMTVSLVFFGVQLIALGVIGEYVGRILLTHNRKPQYVVRSVTRPGAKVADASRADRKEPAL